MTYSNNTSNWQPTGEYRLDWDLTGADGSASLVSSLGNQDVMVSVSTPQNGAGEQFTLDQGKLESADNVKTSNETTIEFGQAVTDLNFQIEDVDSKLDTYKGKHDFDDKVTVYAYGPNGELLDVDFSDLHSSHEVDGNSVEGNAHLDEYGETSRDNVTVKVAGPVVKLVIVHESGGEDDESGVVRLTDMGFNCDPDGGGDLDGIVQNDDDGDLIDENYDGDPHGDMIDNDDAILPGESGDDDIVYAMGGDDTILAGDGDDEVYAGDGDDYVEGGDGDDMIRGDSETREGDVDGGDCDVTANAGDDTLLGGAGNDTIYGEGGDDYIEGNGGDDVLYGDHGQDGTTGPQTVTIDFNDLSSGDIVSGQYDGVTISSASGANPAMIFDTDNPTGGDDDLATDNLGNVLILSEDGDSNDPDDNQGGGTYIFDFEGDVRVDSLTFLDNDEGPATLRFYDADGNLTGTQTVDPTAAEGQKVASINVDGVSKMTVTLVGSAAIDNLVYTTDGGDCDPGTAGNDTILGGEGDDLIYGEDGDDTLTGGEGSDESYGGDGDDTFIVDNADDAANDKVVGGNGPDQNTDYDVLDLTGAGPVTINATADETDADAFKGTVVFEDGQTLSFSQIEEIITDGGNDDPDAVDDTATTTEDEAVIIDLLGNDSDPDGDTITIISGTNPSNGTVTDNGGGTVTYTPDAGFTGTDTFTYTISDGNGGTDTATVTVNVNDGGDNTVDAVNDTYTIDEDTTLIVDVTANDSDPQGDDFSVTSVGAATNGTATLLGDGTVQYKPNDDFNGTDSFTYTITDDQGATDTATVTINVGAVDDDPDAENDVTLTDEGVAVDIDVLANDSDPDGDTLTVIDYAQPTNGDVTDGPGGTLTYTPDADYTGTDTFTYTISDGNGGTDTATVTVVVGDVDDNTVDAVDDSGTTTAPQPVTIDVLANDTDPQGDTFSISGFTDGGNGTVTANAGGQLTYTPDAGFTGVDTFTYTIVDSQGATDTATVTVTVNEGQANTVDAVDDAYDVDEDTTLIVDLTANDSDPQGDDFSVTSVGTPANGTATLNADGTVTYKPNQDYTGTDSFTYTVTDDKGATDTATVTVDMAPVNDNPDAEDDVRVTDDTDPLVIDVLANDTDVDGDPLTVTDVTTPSFGTVTDNGDGTVTYDPMDDFTGTDTFDYTISDGNGGTDTATVTIVVNGDGQMNSVVARDDSADTMGDNVVDIDVLANDSDPQGDTFSVIANTDPSNGSVVDNGDGTFTYTADAGYTGMDSFTYTIQDDKGATDTATVTVNVTQQGVNTVDAVNDMASTTAGTEVTIDVLANDSDPEGDSYAVISNTDAANGTVTDNGDGTFDYQPDAGFTGTDTFTYTIQDDKGATDTATVTVSVGMGPMNTVDAVDDSYDIDEDTTLIVDLTANDSDPQGDDFSVTSVGTPANGTATLNPDGTVTYKPNQDYTGTDSFTYTVTDDKGATDTATVTVNMAPVNDAPDAEDDITVIEEGTPVNIDVLANDEDADNDPLTITAYDQPTNGTVTDGPGGTLTYTPDADYTGTDTFDYTISDGNGATDIATVTVVVQGDGGQNTTNAVDDAYDIDEDSTLIVDVTANDTDAQGDDFSVTAVGTPTNGTATLNADGMVTYKPDADFTGVDTFTYTLTDDRGATDTATVTINVGPVNDNPDAEDDVRVTDDTDPLVIDVLANDTDVDGDTLTVTDVTTPSFGTVTDNGDGTVTYDPMDDFTGTDTFDYTISDGNGGTDTATVTVVVNGDGQMNSVIARDDSATVVEDTPTTIDVLANDSDPQGDTFSVIANTNPSNGTLIDNGDGTFDYTADFGFTGVDSFSYTIQDDQGATDTAVVTITVKDDGNTVDAVNDAATTPVDTEVTIDVVANDSDPEGDPFTVVDYTNASNGSLTDNGDGTFDYQPDTGFTGVDSFTYTIEDDFGNTDTATVTIAVGVGPMNTVDAVDDSYDIDEDSTLIVDLTANDSDPEGDDFSVTSVGTPANGTATLNPDGTVTYKPNLDYTGTDSFTYTVTDDKGATDTATVTVNMAPVNDAPDAEDDVRVIEEGTPVNIDVLANDEDADNDPLTITAYDQPTNGTVTDGPGGTLTYTPDADYTGTDTFDYTISDGNGATDIATVTVVVQDDGGNQNTVVALDDAANTNAGQSVDIDALANDSDPQGDDFFIIANTDPSNGTITGYSDGVFTYVPDGGFTGTDTFTYVLQDENGATDTATVTINVGTVFDTDAVDDQASALTQQPITIDVLANDFDPEGDPLTVIDSTDPSNGTITDNGDGTFGYQSDAGFTGNDTFTYTISDGNGNTDTANVTVSVTSNNAPLVAPVATDDTANVPINDTVTIDVLANDTDPDGDDANLKVIAATPSEGTVVINADGTLTYTPAVDGYITIDYTIQDEDGLTDTATVTVLVNDGIVEGTGGDDLIDTNYTGDPEGDMVDAGDNIFPGKGPDDDIIESYEGDDTVYAGDGDDDVTTGDGADTVYGEDGDDIIDTSAPTEASDYGFAPGETVPNWPFSPLTPAQLVPDDLDEDNDKDTVFGGAGDDTITTGDDDDVIDGGTGDDTIDGGLDDDTITGGEGDDYIIGGHGSDTIEGNDGDDEIWGGLGPITPDILDLEDDAYPVDDYGDADTNDPLSPIPSFLDPRPDNGIDEIRGGDGNDKIYGQDDDDVLYGDAGDDYIDGGIDDDEIYGGDGDDELYGGKGQDYIDGGDGVDEAYGGDDKDYFVNVGPGDFVDGGEGGDDYDTLDLTGTKPTGGSIQITKGIGGNPENGFVDFFDSTGAKTGTMNFVNIEDIVPCFTPGTLIATPKGEVPVEELGEGDRIITRDNGIQEIRWIGQKSMGWQELNRSQHLKPVLIKAGSLGNGLPERDMLVSPNHRMLVANDRTALYFDEREVLASAKHLVSNGIQVVDVKEVTYIHFLFDHHEVVLSDGTWSESFQPGDYSLKGIGNAQRQELFELFPELETREGIEDFTSARRILKKHEAKMLRK